MERLLSIYGALTTNVGLIAITAFVLGIIAAVAVGIYMPRGAIKDRKVITHVDEEDDLTDRDVRWRVQWIRDDIASIFGCLALIAGLLSAILIVLIVKGGPDAYTPAGTVIQDDGWGELRVLEEGQWYRVEDDGERVPVEPE